MKQGDVDRAERLVREAIRMLKPLGDRAFLCESQRLLAEILVRRGRVDEAERYALEAMQTVGPQDVTSLATTRMALGLVRAAQGRDEEAEALLREAVELGADRAPGWIHHALVRALADFLRTRGRPKEAAEAEARIEMPARVA
jgi:ATP/maltotriose-dependent transcriptional regulator MalT